MRDDLTPALTRIIDHLLDAICVVDREGRFIFVSQASERIFGYTSAEMIGRSIIELVHPEDQDKTLHAASRIMAGTVTPYFRNRYIRKNGSVVHIMWSAQWSESDQMRIAVARDITELARAESLQAALFAISEAAHAAEDLPALFRCIHRIVDSLLPTRNFLIALHDETSKALTFPFAVKVDEVAEASPFDAQELCSAVVRSGEASLVAASSDESAGAGWLGVPLRSQTGVIGALAVQHRSGEMTESDQELLKFVSAQIASAVARKQSTARLEYIAGHDALTHLPNRLLFYDRLDTAITRSRRNRTQVALLYIDLDGFKLINDTHGHAAGDLVLQQVARRLARSVRASDSVGRLGGDEFVVALDCIGLTRNALMVAEKIRVALEQPFRSTDDRLLHVSSSIGVAVFPEHGIDCQTLIQRADAAMYMAKSKGKNQIFIALEGVSAVS